ncbi:hypothetical protein BMAPRL20_1363 [Burkholderia mallei PRL-20]|uniref:Uncharacterized protein n=1 Tax=Burkholderia mallei (strain NCTC 10229) TaxID=412022 RepID=A2RXD7_BURM9|nr:hypothetical protein BMA10229_0540 [Burkholderia mallei NCTC 10229]ABO02695.1 hypothetical protein BMA10247_A1027 [Burkholderia mallei NCTC 10247]EDK55437.1 hypothetical protein BMAFMH_E0496 [Burkholderia mallei FMH]EDK84114.1 hypothetical protein BMA721280_L0111 [Burkholderia mallei 2002721280]EEP84329.1 alpha/beta hydrolase family protein [Burkholderia mallei GB8 horse 4]EES42338.1 hypothetical protein BMAPRL20_1363 [Burkholderia mallei PRL-20]
MRPTCARPEPPSARRRKRGRAPPVGCRPKHLRRRARRGHARDARSKQEIRRTDLG